MKTVYKKLIISCTAGNILELYNFILFGYFSHILSILFFPKSDPRASLMLTFAVFATGCLMRPLGAIFFGFFGDKFGRRKIVVFSLTMMTIFSGLIGCLPTHNNIGDLASLLLLLCRLCQGFSMSGEEVGAAILLSELLPRKKQGLAGSIILGSVYIGLLVGSMITLVTNISLSEEQVLSWGWRLPFIFSIFIGVLCIFWRIKSLQESEEFMVVEEKKLLMRNPIYSVLKHYKKELLNCIFATATLAVSIYLFAVFIPSYFSLVFSFKVSMIVSSIYFFMGAILTFYVGKLTDKVGYLKPMIFSCIGFIVFSYPIFFFFSTHNIAGALLAEFLLVILVGTSAGSLMPFLINSFPTEVRLSGVGISFNLSMTIFGSTTPLLVLYLTKITASENAPFIYLVAVALLTLYSILSPQFFKNKFTQQLKTNYAD